jgi:hypothetical protein
MAIGPIMVQLMEKSPIESGNIGLEDSTRWSANAINFLSLTTSPSLRQLATVSPKRPFGLYITDLIA